MKCKYWEANRIRYGKQKDGTHRYRCNNCEKVQQEMYKNNSYLKDADSRIVLLLKEGCGIRSISRILSVSKTTVSKRILQIASNLKAPPYRLRKDL